VDASSSTCAGARKAVESFSFDDSVGPAAVDDVDDAGGERRLVRREIPRAGQPAMIGFGSENNSDSKGSSYGVLDRILARHKASNATIRFDRISTIG
jgi:hypothetical protein